MYDETKVEGIGELDLVLDYVHETWCSVRFIQGIILETRTPYWEIYTVLIFCSSDVAIL